MQLSAALFFTALAHVAHEKHFLAQDVPAVQADSAVPPVSTTMKAVINLTIQYFILYSAVALIKTFNELRPQNAMPKALKICEAGCKTVNYAPMLSVLFIGVRMRALQLSKGQPDEHGLPQWYVKDAMLACAWSVLVQTLMVIVVGCKGGDVEVSDDGTPQVSGTDTFSKVLVATRYAAMLVTYGGFTTVVVGAFMMNPPKELWPDGVPPVSPAVGSTMNLSAQYFFVYLGVAVCKTYTDFYGSSDFVDRLDAAFNMATNTVNFAPMLCILFIGARMRALQIDPVAGNPQPWAQNCFFACAYSVLIQLALIFVIPFALGGKTEKGSTEGDIVFKLEGQDTLLAGLNAVRFLLMAALYGGFTAVIYSVHTIEGKGGNPAPPVSPAMQCVINLTVQFFLVYLLLWVFATCKQMISSVGKSLDSAISVVDTARKTVQFCPMLCVLFIGLRLRALQITDQKGAPQGWAQQGMFLATYAVLFQILVIFLLGVLQGAPKVDEDGNPKVEGAGAAAIALSCFRYLALLCLYGGAVVCVTALFKITPETANGEGSLIHPAVDVPAPSGVPVMF